MKKFYLMLAIVGLIVVQSCKKQEGCTDTQAMNYDANSTDKGAANVCDYGPVTFYFNDLTEGTDTIQAVNLYILNSRGEYIDSTVLTALSPDTPYCNVPTGYSYYAENTFRQQFVWFANYATRTTFIDAITETVDSSNSPPTITYDTTYTTQEKELTARAMGQFYPSKNCQLININP